MRAEPGTGGPGETQEGREGQEGAGEVGRSSKEGFWAEGRGGAGTGPGHTQRAGEWEGTQSQGRRVCCGTGRGEHPHPIPPPRPPAMEGGGRTQAGDAGEDRQMAARAVGRQPAGVGAVGSGDTTDGQGRGVEKSGGQVAGGDPGKRPHRPRTWGWTEDTQGTGGRTGGRQCRRGPRGQGQAEGARWRPEREAEAGRAAVFVELSAAVEL